jgi:hypothetical protein
MLLAISFADAAQMNMRVFPINDHLLCFYDGRPAETTTPPSDHNWADFGALNVGVATYVVHRGDRALVYDTYPTGQDSAAADSKESRDRSRNGMGTAGNHSTGDS